MRVPESVVLETGSEEETRALGALLGAAARGGERIGLAGELGAGKTCLVRGIAEGLGVRAELVRSPTFTLINCYEGGRLPLFHIDLFRLAPGQMEPEELREYLYGTGVCAVEWFERLEEPLSDFLEISLTFVGEETRRLVAVGHGVGYDSLLSVLRERAG
jgi:tRNA threonylcarbamoyladenosine biosynthesis protein TsaE